MIPVIAIAGRPNVGKSTLFNCLTKTSTAVVADTPGVTRDRLYGKGQSGENAYVIIDTGGLSSEENGIEGLTVNQAKQAISEADIVLFVVDARAGLMAFDYNIAKQLRKLNKSILLVINKIDGLDPHIASSDFHALGLEKAIAVSSAHRQNIPLLVNMFLESFSQKFEHNNHNNIDTGIKIALIGKPNTGKSTLANRMLGEDRVIVFDQPGTTRDSIYMGLERAGKKYTLIDTAGLRRKSHITEFIEKISVVKALQAIEDAHVVIFLIDARSNIAEQDLNLLGFILESGKALVIAINKWDGLLSYQRQQVKLELDRRLQFIDFAKIKFISALHGTGVGELFKDINIAYDSAMKKLSTPVLTRLLQKAVEQHQPPMIHGHRIKLRYAHGGGQNPLVIVIHGNQTKNLPGSYIRYLQGFFRKTLKIIGAPIRLELKESENPYQNKRKVITKYNARNKNTSPNKFKPKSFSNPKSKPDPKVTSKLKSKPRFSKSIKTIKSGNSKPNIKSLSTRIPRRKSQ